MEKQLTFFQMEKKDDFQCWSKLPEKNRRKIETIFAKLLIRHLNAYLEEAKGDEE